MKNYAVQYKEDIPFVLAHSRALTQWIDVSGEFLWVLEKCVKGNHSTFLKISRIALSNKGCGMHHTSFIHCESWNGSISVWRSTNLVALLSRNRVVHVYCCWTGVKKKSLCVRRYFSALHGIRGFQYQNRITALVLFSECYALVYIIENTHHSLLLPSYVWQMLGTPLYDPQPTGKGLTWNIDTVVASDNNALYWIHGQRVIQARLCLLGYNASVYTDDTCTSDIVAYPATLVENFNIFNYFLNSIWRILKKPADSEDPKYALHLHCVLDFGSIHYGDLCGGVPLQLSVNSTTISHVLQDEIYNVGQLKAEASISGTGCCSHLDILWVITEDQHVGVLRLFLDTGDFQGEPLFVYPFSRGVYCKSNPKPLENRKVLRIVVTAKNDLFVFWCIIDTLSRALRRLSCSIFPFPLTLWSPLRISSSTPLRLMKTIISMIDVPAATGDVLLSPTKNKNPRLSLKKEPHKITHHQQRKKPVVYSLTKANDSLVEDLQLVEHSLLFHTQGPRVALSRLNPRNSTTWTRTHSFHFVSLLVSGLSKNHYEKDHHESLNSTVYRIGRYKFDSEGYRVMDYSRRIRLSLKSNTVCLPELMRLLGLEEHEKSWKASVGVLLLYGRLRCTCCIARNFGDQLVKWSERMVYTLLLVSKDHVQVAGKTDARLLYNILLSRRTMETCNVFDLAARYRFELEQLQQCLMYALKVLGEWDSTWENSNKRQRITP